MTPDERWYEAVKHLKKACELLEGRLVESTVVEHNNLFKKYTLIFDEQVLSETEDKEGPT